MEYAEDVIREALDIRKVSHDGWHSVYCEMCGDGGRTKGPRGGWHFGGDNILYHCFNLNCDGSFNHTREQPFSADMWEIFKSFDVDIPRLKKIINEYQLKHNYKSTKVERTKTKLKYLKVPDYFIPVKKSGNIIAQRAIKYLESRNVNYKDYQFYISSGVTNMGIQHTSIARSLLNRVIIPFMHNSNMIYYQARSLIKTAKNKYINANISKTNIIYGMDELYKNIHKPLFVTEGFFDAYQLNGVSVQENRLSPEQIKILSQSPRTKIIVPDYNGDNYKLAEQGIELGWGVALPDYNVDVKDTSEAIVKLGKLTTLQYISNAIYFDFEAQTRLMVIKL